MYDQHPVFDRFLRFRIKIILQAQIKAVCDLGSGQERHLHFFPINSARFLEIKLPAIIAFVRFFDHAAHSKRIYAVTAAFPKYFLQLLEPLIWLGIVLVCNGFQLEQLVDPIPAHLRVFFQLFLQFLSALLIVAEFQLMDQKVALPVRDDLSQFSNGRIVDVLYKGHFLFLCLCLFIQVEQQLPVNAAKLAACQRRQLPRHAVFDPAAQVVQFLLIVFSIFIVIRDQIAGSFQMEAAHLGKAFQITRTEQWILVQNTGLVIFFVGTAQIEFFLNFLELNTARPVIHRQHSEQRHIVIRIQCSFCAPCLQLRVFQQLDIGFLQKIFQRPPQFRAESTDIALVPSRKVQRVASFDLFILTDHKQQVQQPPIPADLAGFDPFQPVDRTGWIIKFSKVCPQDLCRVERERIGSQLLGLICQLIPRIAHLCRPLDEFFLFQNAQHFLRIQRLCSTAAGKACRIDRGDRFHIDLLVSDQLRQIERRKHLFPIHTDRAASHQRRNDASRFGRSRITLLLRAVDEQIAFASAAQTQTARTTNDVFILLLCQSDWRVSPAMDFIISYDHDLKGQVDANGQRFCRYDQVQMLRVVLDHLAQTIAHAGMMIGDPVSCQLLDLLHITVAVALV